MHEFTKMYGPEEFYSGAEAQVKKNQNRKGRDQEAWDGSDNKKRSPIFSLPLMYTQYSRHTYGMPISVVS